MTPDTDLLGKTVLLVDSNEKLAEMRARRLRGYGVTVHTARTIQEARVDLRLNRYDLVLLATRENLEAAIALRREIREQNPKQRVAFLVGPPRYISFTFGQNVVPMPGRSNTWADRLKGHLASA